MPQDFVYSSLYPALKKKLLGCETMSNDYKVGIPVIDLASFQDRVNNERGCLQTIQFIAEACRDYGFFYVKNHGVSERVQSDLLNALKSFFALPQYEKERIKSQGTSGMVGYFSFESETTAYLVNGNPDWREGLYALGEELPDSHPSKQKFPLITQKNMLPKEPKNFKDVVAAYHKELKVLGFKIMTALAQGMGKYNRCHSTSLAHNKCSTTHYQLADNASSDTFSGR